MDDNTTSPSKTNTHKTIEMFEVLDHGVEHEQYFQGCGVSFTEFDDVATGIGDCAAEAVDDALEQLAMAGWETDGMDERIRDEWGQPSRLPAVEEIGEECHHYVSIRVR